MERRKTCPKQLNSAKYLDIVQVEYIWKCHSQSGKGKVDYRNANKERNVTDFPEVHFEWPSYNLLDTSITVALCAEPPRDNEPPLLVVSTFMPPRKDNNQY
ncbi:hypothetical protein M514_03231 [Trichuris suis]|uniref:Uncharacterized protein n=1 Tax=Trichuris suis TaxID=68888 RepID=A0A085MEZ6_9BILA|nr:hypothetical protein M513_03231 [Trichuris suis]KFD61762.1 hypothetical protein M514_03231 [Trichuris suis]